MTDRPPVVRPVPAALAVVVLLALPRLRWYWVLGTAIGCLLVVQGRARRQRGTSESPGEA